MFEMMKRAWGANQSRVFKLQAWGAALAVFGIYTYLSRPTPTALISPQKQKELEAEFQKKHGSAAAAAASNKK